MRQALIQEYYDSPEYLTKLRKKVSVLKELETDELGRFEKMERYATDPVAFIEDFCLIKFTEFGGDPKPFFLFPYQKKIIYKMQEAEMSNEDIDLLIDKPRGMGLTWLVSAYFLWRFLFTPNYSCFILSRTESEVDDGTAMPDNSIFGKIRWMMARLPRHIIPEGFKFKITRGTETDSTLKLINPTIGSSIIGSSTNSNAGRSKRYRTVFIDECFFIENFLSVYKALTSVARLKIFVSTTVESKVAGDFKNMCEKNDSYVSLTWRDHPFKDQQWYNELQAKADALNDPDLMREAEVNYAISSKAQYYPQISEATVAPLEYIRDRPMYCGLDFGGRQDYTVIIYAQWDGKLKILDAYFNTNKPTDWYAPFLSPEVLYNPDYYNEFQKKFIEEKIKPRNKPVGYFGEQDHLTKRRPDNKSDQDALAPFGIRIHINSYAIQHEPRRIAAAAMLPRTIFNQNSDGAMKIYDAIANSRYTNNSRTTSEQLKPVHDPQVADMRAAFENLCVNIPRIFRNQRGIMTSSGDKSFANAIIKKLRI